MNKFELHLAYKSETSNTFTPMEALAFWSRKGFDIILDSEDLDYRIISMMENCEVGKEKRIEFPDPDYCNWLEEKVIELTKERDDSIHLHNYKEDYEDAKYQIGQLEDELDNARDEIYELNKKQ